MSQLQAQSRPCIMVTAGGTGGHVFPALAVANVLQQRGYDIVWLGTRKGLEAKLVPEAGIEMEWLSVNGLRGNGLFGWLKAPFTMFRAVLQAKAALQKREAVMVLGMGGFVAGPGGLAARWLGLPLVIHEQNAIAGMTNTWLSKLASKVLQAFPNTFDGAAGRRAETMGNPVRAEIEALPAPVLLEQARPVRLLVLGGSLGALSLNKLMPVAIKQLGMPVSVQHQAGQRTLEQAQEAYQQAGLDIQATAFVADMAQAYEWADVVVCRAGALTVAELAAAGKPAVLVPYPHAVDDHQSANAAYLADAKAAIIVQEQDMTADNLVAVLQPLLADAQQRLQMGLAARQQAWPKAAEHIAEICIAQISTDDIHANELGRGETQDD